MMGVWKTNKGEPMSKFKVGDRVTSRIDAQGLDKDQTYTVTAAIVAGKQSSTLPGV